ncbi:major facilitator superfamily transporter [Grosmannia clavigera kw1407]|uniref:Major facilitator superfamily transporter n=1 Tax=Grosmannia clavigera (strain kw1407 / UAMH 11150) TaxID=655863 RepID=F0XKS7_GROCL|nr:major facilitator superfamily transporter [Grosmannia clavigera kw1407]EFX01759.1 major facilitator superfamily transporter [Grosmannia clavigera kw1407]
MSLNRVASLESFGYVRSDHSSRRGSDVSVRSRRISFNPLPDEWDPPDERTDNIQAISAFEVPQWKRVLQVLATVVYCLLAAGIVFGYAAIKPVLKKEGAYQERCANAGDRTDRETCVEMHLNFMFTVAAVGTNVAALPIGAILDHRGPRLCGLLGAGFLFFGALTMAHARALPFDGYLVGYLLLACGGPFTYISSFQLSNAFPRHSGLILAMLTGAFDASSALFLGYRVVYERTGGAFGQRQFFLAYLVVPVAIVVLQLTLLPRQSYKTVGELMEQIEDDVGPAAAAASRQPVDQVDEHTALLQEEARVRHESVAAEIEELLGSAKADKQAVREEKKNEISGVWGVMHNYTALEQVRSPWFVLICCFTVIQMTRINYFVATVRPQYEALLGSHEKAVAINNFFDMALPLGGILSIPFIGLFLDNNSTVLVLAVLVTTATTIGVFGLIPREWAAYVNICIFVLYRPFYYTAVSDYSAKVFGFRTFGTVYGAIICLAGLFNFSQSFLDYLFHQVFRGNPIPVNVILLSVALAVGLGLVTYVGVQSRGIKRRLLEQEAEDAFMHE